MTNAPIPSSIIKIGGFVLFDCNFNMPRMHHVGLRPRDSVVCGGTLWLRCYALNNHTKSKYKFKFYDKPDGKQGLVVNEFVSRYGMERRPSKDEMFAPVRDYLKAQAEKVKMMMEKKRTKKTIFHINNERKS